MITRVIFGILLIVSAFIFPWWVSFTMGLIGLFYFNNLYEVIFVGLILDSLYGIHFNFYGFTFIMTAGFLIAYFIISRFKKSLLI